MMRNGNKDKDAILKVFSSYVKTCLRRSSGDYFRKKYTILRIRLYLMKRKLEIIVSV
ncbi:hypothetical protein PRIO_2621 [Paenibacillus riograndensis SBR5]|uniref:Uncharacterized protein n=1 Tax=Paenibacillus riograndensis SBR5 TaxID=1073571 RepID=A0A0E4HAL2_9BACL|nr:hypothetical protein PRIO_2621 [Paenibacillus riograndensis SBR5]